MDLNEVVSRLEIEQVLISYCRGVDRHDYDLVANAFHPDAIDEHGPRVGSGHELALRLADLADDPDAGGGHRIGNIYIEFDDPDHARAETYVMAHHPRRNEAGTADEILVFSGRYLDRLERRDDGKWRIAFRRVVSDWHRVERLEEPAPGFPVGRRDPGMDLASEFFPPINSRVGHGV